MDNPVESPIVNKEIIKSRKETYGNNFPKIASLWKAYLKKRFGIVVDISPEDTAIMMALMKVSRLNNSPEEEDTITDLFNYFWIGLNYEDYLKGGKVEGA